MSDPMRYFYAGFLTYAVVDMSIWAIRRYLADRRNYQKRLAEIKAERERMLYE